MNTALVGAVFVVFTPILTAQAIAEESGRSGKEVVESVCVACHGDGQHGAPRIGDRQAWGKRTSLGLTGLTQNALKGIRQMPAHGGNPALTDLEIGRAVTHMVNQSGGNWIEPASARDLAASRSGERIVAAYCSKCHRTGEGGAPRIGDKEAWLPRLRQGFDHLVQSAIRGHGGMPARGGVANLTDMEIRDAVAYLFNPDAPAPSAQPHRAPHMAASADPNYKIVGNIGVHLGIVPAKHLRGFPTHAPERSMHGGVPAGRDYQHVNVSVVDRESNAPISDARVEIRVEEPGLGSESITLEPMAVGLASYGTYLRMKPRTHYLITVRVQTPGSTQASEVRFEHEH